MPINDPNHQIGRQGVLIVMMHLEKIGAVVNTMEQDYGWDLTVQLPEKPTILNSASRQPVPMSGRIALIQVKRQTSDIAPSISKSTLHMWNESDGSSTFFFLSKLSDDIELLTYATPGDLRDFEQMQSVVSSKSKNVSTASLTLRPYVAANFAALIDLWTRFPKLMVLYEDEISRWLSEQRIPIDELVSFTADVAEGWLNRFRPGGPDVDQDWPQRIQPFEQAAAEACRLTEPDVGLNSSALPLSVTQWAHGWSEGLNPSVYSASNDEEIVRSDAIRCIEHVVDIVWNNPQISL